MKALALGGLLGVLVLVGCRGSSGGFSSRSNGQSGDVLHLALSVAPTTLDPHKVQDVETGPVLMHVYETLVDYDENSKIAPKLAERWSIADGGKSYRFTLAKATFSDGTPVTSADVKASFERALSPSLASPVATTYLGDIAGATEFNEGKSKRLDAVETPDPNTVIIHLKTPTGAFLGKITYPCTSVMKVQGKAGMTELDSIQAAIGSGPFKFGSYEPDRQISLVRRADARGTSPPLDRIEYRVVRDAATRLNLFRQGQLDILSLERAQIRTALAEPALKAQMRAVPRPAVYYLLLNPKRYPPFANPKVRRAIAMAIDRDRLTRQVLGELEPAPRWVPPEILPGNPGSLPPFAPGAAKSLLGSAGAGKLPPVELTVRADNPDTKAIAESVTADLGKNLGIEVLPSQLEWGAMLKRRNRAELAFAYLNWSADYIDPENFLSLLLRSDAPLNFDGWKDAEFDSLCRRADAMEPSPERNALYLKAEGVLLRELPRIPLYFGRDQVLVAPRVSGLRVNALGIMNYATTRVK